MNRWLLEISRKDLGIQYQNTRNASIAMCAPLPEKDYWVKQPIIDVSPPGWNIGHTSWFFRNVLERFGGVVTDTDRTYDHYLNSYYSVLGERMNRAERGDDIWIRVTDLLEYRHTIDQRMIELINSVSEIQWPSFAWTVMLGLQHERQHQELFYTEIKYFRYTESERRPYRGESTNVKVVSDIPLTFLTLPGGRASFGNLEGGWCFDNELGVHSQCLQDFSIAERLITNKEYCAFIDAGGYSKEDLWQAEGWKAVRMGSWIAPLYWEKIGNAWHTWTFADMQPIDPFEPVSHISFWEAEAYARWLSRSDSRCNDVRLPTEYEWEQAARTHATHTHDSNFIHTNTLRPRAYNGAPLSQMFGDVWEWTTSSHVPYPGYLPFPHPFTEYTSKFMYTPLILRGGSCVSERDHIRTSYRNYWAPDVRFQVSGIRLAKGV